MKPWKWRKRVVIGPAPCGVCGAPVGWDGVGWIDWDSPEGRFHDCSSFVFPDRFARQLFAWLTEDATPFVPHG